MAWKTFDNNGALLLNTQGVPNPAYTSTAHGLTAYAGGGQSNATQLAATFNFIDTVATNGDSVKAYPAIMGYTISIQNRGAADLAVYPFVGDEFYGESANAVYTYPIVNGATLKLICASTGTWSIIT